MSPYNPSWLSPSLLLPPNQGSTCVGLRSRTHAVLAAANKAASELSSHQRKFFRVVDHAGVVLTGLTTDGHVLSRFIRSECINHAFIYDAPLPISRLALWLADKPQGLCPRCQCTRSPPLLASGSHHRCHGDHRQTPDILGEHQSSQDICTQNVVTCQAMTDIVSSSLGLDERKSSIRKAPKSQDNDNADNNGEALIEGDYRGSGHAEDGEHIVAPRPKRSKKLMIYTHYIEL